MKRAIHFLFKKLGYRVVRIEDGALAGPRASELAFVRDGSRLLDGVKSYE
jgi:hypothetical protein